MIAQRLAPWHGREAILKLMKDNTEECPADIRNCMMEEDEQIQNVLDQFVNSHEQTYEEFLGTFTHLCKGEKGLLSRTSDASLETHGVRDLLSQRSDTAETTRVTIGSAVLSTNPPQDEDQIVLDEGLKVGGCNLDDLSLAGRVKVDNFLDANNFEEDEDPAPQEGSGLLPGEAENVASSHVPSFTRNTQLQMTALPPTQHPSDVAEEITNIDVEPFSLDPKFDYDRVVLTPKFSGAELKAVAECSVCTGDTECSGQTDRCN